MNKALLLDDDQKKALANLKRAFPACHAAKIEIHGELNTLYALNGRHMTHLRVGFGEVCDEEMSVSNNAEQFVPKCFYGCAADDGLSLHSKYGSRKFKDDDDGGDL